MPGWLRRLLARYGPGRPRARAWWIAGAYALFAGLWIVHSDRVLGTLVSDPADLVRFSTAKGIAFVTVTSVLLLALIRGAYGRMTRMAEELVSKDRKLGEVEARLEAVVEHLREGLVIAEPEGSFRHWNPAALQVLGFEDVEEGRRLQPRFTELFELFTLEGERLPRERWPLARVRAGEVLDNLEIRVRRSGTDWERIISYAGAQVRYLDDRRLVFLTLRDVTRGKIAEHQLRQAHDTLELRVRERTAELSTARVRAEMADRLKSAFLATMSHELRTPLNSIIGFTGIVLQELPGPLNAEQRKQLGMVRSSARHLLALINDVLDLSKIEAGELEVHRERFDLTTSIHQAVEVIRPMADQKELVIDVRLGPGLEAMDSDRRRVEQILLNLLNNAVKFTEQGGVTLTAERVTGEAPSVRVSVADTGIGIAAHDLVELFQPFRQLDTGLTRVHEGTGLGLAICRRLAGLLGGSIEAHSEPLRGSTFVVTLPLSMPE